VKCGDGIKFLIKFLNFNALAQNLKKETPLALSFLSVRLHGTTRLPLEGFSRKLILEYFSKISRELHV
jgi:hypothetical protein